MKNKKQEETNKEVITGSSCWGVFTQDELNDLGKWIAYKARKRPCDHTHRHTRSFLRKRRIPVAVAIKWLEENHGYCDCEVLLNVWFTHYT